jgi:anti-anti-sigma factor
MPACRRPERAPRLTVEVCDRGDDALVRLKGDAGYLEAEVVSVALLSLCARRPALVTFDLGELESISSLALGALVGFCRNAGRWGGRVRLVAPWPRVREMVEAAGLLDDEDSRAGSGASPALALP